MARIRAIRRLAAATAAASLLLPAVAAARVAEIGVLDPLARGSCPDAGLTLVPVPPDQICQALTKLTGYQAKVGTDRTLYQAPENGRIVGWTIALGNPAKSQVAYFESRYGGPAQAAIVVLSVAKKLSRTVVAKGPVMPLTGYFGQVVQFPLVQTLEIKKGQYVGLTVPTWVPAMQLGRMPDTSWRSSRDKSGCNDYTTQFGLLGKRGTATFACLYKSVRLTYSATFISDAPPVPVAK